MGEQTEKVKDFRVVSEMCVEPKNQLLKRSSGFCGFHPEAAGEERARGTVITPPPKSGHRHAYLDLL